MKNVTGSVGVVLLAIASSLGALTACNGGNIADPQGLAENGNGPGSQGPGSSNEKPLTLGASLTPREPCIQPACERVPLLQTTNAIRLTHSQWENSTRDLLKLPTASGLSSTFPADPAPPKDQFGVDVSQLIVSSQLWQAYQTSAESLAALVTGSPAQLALILPAAAQNTGATTDARVSAFLADFLPRAFRMAPDNPIIADPNTGAIVTLTALGDTIVAEDSSSDPFTISIKWVITQVLQSPYFLYRVEAGGSPPDINGRARLGSYEVVEKLSYALWNTMPDDPTRAAALTLKTNADVANLARTMVNDPRASTVIAKFHDLLFNVPLYPQIVTNPDLYPAGPLSTRGSFTSSYTPAQFAADAAEDVDLTVKHLVIDNAKGSLRDLYTSRDAWVTPALAQVYDIPQSALTGTPTPDGFYEVTLPSPRMGIPSHAGWLAYLSHVNDPASILRGVWFARHFLCIPLGSPPAGAVNTPISTANATTNRDRITLVTAGQACQGCHPSVINPMGFAFEEFNALGRYREWDNGVRIDSTGFTQILGAFQDAPSMLTDALTKPDSHACYAAHWNAYLNGTPEVSARPEWLTPIIYDSMNGASMRDIIVDLVQTDAFMTATSALSPVAPYVPPNVPQHHPDLIEYQANPGK